MYHVASALCTSNWKDMYLHIFYILKPILTFLHTENIRFLFQHPNRKQSVPTHRMSRITKMRNLDEWLTARQPCVSDGHDYRIYLPTITRDHLRRWLVILNHRLEGTDGADARVSLWRLAQKRLVSELDAFYCITGLDGVERITHLVLR